MELHSNGRYNFITMDSQGDTSALVLNRPERLSVSAYESAGEGNLTLAVHNESVVQSILHRTDDC
jgi:hypothetical protein